jgi:peptide/nickel transport system ATP-binding protein
MLFITHDLGIIAYICTDIAVMYAGKILEIGEVKEIYNHPAHPYTQALLQSIPRVDQRVEKLYGISGAPPNLNDLPEGCAFAPRCKQKLNRCDTDGFPPEVTISAGHRVRCWKYV